MKAQVSINLYLKGGSAGFRGWEECFSNSLNNFFETVPDDFEALFSISNLLEDWQENYQENTKTKFLAEPERGNGDDYSVSYLGTLIEFDGWADFDNEEVLKLEREFLKKYYPKQLSEDEMDKIIKEFNTKNKDLLSEIESKLRDSLA